MSEESLREELAVSRAELSQDHYEAKMADGERASRLEEELGLLRALAEEVEVQGRGDYRDADRFQLSYDVAEALRAWQARFSRG